MLPPTYTSQLQENPPQNGSFNKFEAPCFSPHFQGVLHFLLQFNFFLFIFTHINFKIVF